MSRSPNRRGWPGSDLAGQSSSDAGRATYVPWTPAEDKLLVAVLDELRASGESDGVLDSSDAALHLQSGPVDTAQRCKFWNKVGNLVGRRSAKQCRERWFNSLDPSIKHEPWSIEEDLRLQEAQAKHGNKWTHIASLLAGRTENGVKTRFKSIQRARKRQWTPQEDALLLQLYRQHGPRWSDIQMRLPERSLHGVKVRYRTLISGSTHKALEAGSPEQSLSYDYRTFFPNQGPSDHQQQKGSATELNVPRASVKKEKADTTRRLVSNTAKRTLAEWQPLQQHHEQASSHVGVKRSRPNIKTETLFGGEFVGSSDDEFEVHGLDKTNDALLFNLDAHEEGDFRATMRTHSRFANGTSALAHSQQQRQQGHHAFYNQHPNHRQQLVCDNFEATSTITGRSSKTKMLEAQLNNQESWYNAPAWQGKEEPSIIPGFDVNVWNRMATQRSRTGSIIPPPTASEPVFTAGRQQLPPRKQQVHIVKQKNRLCSSVSKKPPRSSETGRQYVDISDEKAPFYAVIDDMLNNARSNANVDRAEIEDFEASMVDILNQDKESSSSDGEAY